MLSFENLQSEILTRLRNSLPEGLTYHSVDHTIDVIACAERIGVGEKIESSDLFLLKIAALFHDTGFLFVHAGHEKKSCEIATESLKNHGFTDMEIEKVCSMIMATQIPQSPKDKLAEILCDADLDYLGRDDFFKISDTLFKEFVTQKIVKDFDEWNRVQVKFFESHRYFTETSKMLREPGKQMHLAKIRELI